MKVYRDAHVAAPQMSSREMPERKAEVARALVEWALMGPGR